MGSRCEHCGRTERPDGSCAACELHQAAVLGVEVAVKKLALSRNPRVNGSAWVNRYGIFALVDGVTVQIGSSEEAAPFMEFIARAGSVHLPQAELPLPPRGPDGPAQEEETAPR